MALVQSEQQLLSLLEDALRQSYPTQKVIGFLDEARVQTAQRFLQNRRFEDYVLDGGYDGASRVLLVLSPKRRKAVAQEFVSAVTLEFRREDVLGHRDVLGSLMGLDLERELIGDILMEPGRAVVFTYPHTAELICNELSKVGRVGVQTRLGTTLPLPPGETLEDLSYVVSSLRLDCVTAAITGLGREKAVELIRRGLVKCDSEILQQPDKVMKAPCVLSLRGYGKFRFEGIDGVTKRDRFRIHMKKYQ